MWLLYLNWSGTSWRPRSRSRRRAASSWSRGPRSGRARRATARGRSGRPTPESGTRAPTLSLSPCLAGAGAGSVVWSSNARQGNTGAEGVSTVSRRRRHTDTVPPPGPALPAAAAPALPVSCIPSPVLYYCMLVYRVAGYSCAGLYSTVL